MTHSQVTKLLQSKVHYYTHTHTHGSNRLTAIFKMLHNPLSYILDPCISLRQTKTFHIFFTTIPPCLPRMSLIHVHLTPLQYNFSWLTSVPLQSTLLNHQSHWFQSTKGTWYKFLHLVKMQNDKYCISQNEVIEDSRLCPICDALFANFASTAKLHCVR